MQGNYDLAIKNMSRAVATAESLSTATHHHPLLARVRSDLLQLQSATEQDPNIAQLLPPAPQSLFNSPESLKHVQSMPSGRLPPRVLPSQHSSPYLAPGLSVIDRHNLATPPRLQRARPMSEFSTPQHHAHQRGVSTPALLPTR
jgi:hypothetical protein